MKFVFIFCLNVLSVVFFILEFIFKLLKAFLYDGSAAAMDSFGKLMKFIYLLISSLILNVGLGGILDGYVASGIFLIIAEEILLLLVAYVAFFILVILFCLLENIFVTAAEICDGACSLFSRAYYKCIDKTQSVSAGIYTGHSLVYSPLSLLYFISVIFRMFTKHLYKFSVAASVICFIFLNYYLPLHFRIENCFVLIKIVDKAQWLEVIHGMAGTAQIHTPIVIFSSLIFLALLWLFYVFPCRMLLHVFQSVSYSLNSSPDLKILKSISSDRKKEVK